MDIKRTLEEEARRCQWLVLWLDCDREGENIAFEVIDVCRAVNCHLTIRRARFSALIERFWKTNVCSFSLVVFFGLDLMQSDVGNPREIHHATQNLVDPNPWFSDAVDARQVSNFPYCGRNLRVHNWLIIIWFTSFHKLLTYKDQKEFLWLIHAFPKFYFDTFVEWCYLILVIFGVCCGLQWKLSLFTSHQFVLCRMLTCC